MNAEFSVETEQLAFTVRPEMGEEDNLIVYPDPDIKVLENLYKSKTRTELWNDLPMELGYKDCGGFVVDIAGQEQPMELFLIKDLATGK